MKHSLLMKILPYFSTIMVIYWAYELVINIKGKRTGRIVIDTLICLGFLIGLVGSIIYNIKIKN